MKSIQWLSILTVLALLTWPGSALAEGGTVLQRAPDAPADRALGEPPTDGGMQIQKMPVTLTAQTLPDLRTDEGKQELIRRSYLAVSLYSRASGHRPTYELSDFRTIPRVDFGRYEWFDLVTPPGGQVIQVTRHTVRGAQGTPIRRHYTPRWIGAPQDYANTTEGKRFAHARIDEILAVAARDMPQLLGVTSVTAYRVTVTLGGETRSYRAAFLWKETGAGLTYQAYDQVTGRVDEAITETVPAGPVEVQSQPSVDDLRNISAAIDDETCESGSVADRSFGLSSSGFTGHTTGAHELDGAVSMHCDCDTTCAQTCEANVTGTCNDWGDTGTCHVMSNPSEDHSGATTFNAHLSGNTATCGGGLGCAWKECLGCFCSVTVSVSWNGSGLSVSTTTADAATLKDSHSLTCPTCTVATTDEPTDDSSDTTTSGGGGGGGDGGGGCSCDCDGDGWVTVLECETECGGIADVENGTCWVGEA